MEHVAHSLRPSARPPDRTMHVAIATLAICAASAWVFAIWCIAQRHTTVAFPAHVTDMVTGVDAEHPYAVRLDDEPWALSFRRPPGLDTGTEVIAHYNRAGRFVGWTAYGRFTPARHQPSTGLFFVPLGLAVCLTWVTVYIARGERVPEDPDGSS